jgi:peptidoglycan hydrolase CwlO-like protein
VRGLLVLQIGDLSTVLIVVVGIVFAVIVVFLIANTLRRRSVMSDELTAEWEKKFEAIKPAAMTQKEQPVAPTPTPQPYSQVEDRSGDFARYSALQTELQETKGRLQRNLEDIVTLKENESRIRDEVSGLRSQVTSLQEQTSTSQDQIQTLRTQIEDGRSRDQAEHSALQADVRELRESRGSQQPNLEELAALKESGARVQNDIQGLQTQISSLQERFIASQEEILKLKTQLEASVIQPQQQPQQPGPPPQPPIQAQDFATQKIGPPPSPQPQTRAETWVSRHFGNVLNRRTCPTCGRPVRSGDMYCDSCGQLLPRTT